MNNTPQDWFRRGAWLWLKGLQDVGGFIVPRTQAAAERKAQEQRRRNRLRGGHGNGRLRFQ